MPLTEKEALEVFGVNDLSKFEDADAFKSAIEKGVIPGPRLLVTTKAIVATGSYAPRNFAPEWRLPQGADEADGEKLRTVVREQICGGADWIKVYADTPHGPDGKPRPAFSLDELKWIVSTARDAGVPVVAHAQSKEGMRRAALAGVETIEHGDDGDVEVFRLMAKHNVGYCPTLAAAEAYARYFDKWRPGQPETPALKAKRASFKAALEAGEGIDAVVMFYGRVVSDSAELEALSAPLLGVFAQQDDGIPLRQVTQFRSQLRDLGKSAVVLIHSNVAHDFANPDSAAYDHDAAVENWTGVIDFLGRSLR